MISLDTKDKAERDLLRVAFHEVSHAKVAERNKIGARAVRIGGRHDHETGWTELRRRFNPKNAHGYLCVAVAGYLGEAKLLKEFGYSRSKALDAAQHFSATDIDVAEEIQREFSTRIKDAEKSVLSTFWWNWKEIEKKSLRLASEAQANGGKGRLSGFWSNF